MLRSTTFLIWSKISTLPPTWKPTSHTILPAAKRFFSANASALMVGRGLLGISRTMV